MTTPYEHRAKPQEPKSKPFDAEYRQIEKKSKRPSSEEDEELSGFIELDQAEAPRKRSRTPLSRRLHRELGARDKTTPSLESIPWKRETEEVNRNLFLNLHEEILDFVTFISPTDEEKEARRLLVDDMQKIAKDLWPESELHAFGSTATEMFLPTSDVDMVIFNCPAGTEVLYTLAEHLQEADLVSYLEVVDTARIPIVKFQHKESKLNADICFNVEGGLETASLIKSYMKMYPAFRPLTLVLKYYLTQRNLNETYQGGIGSFLLQIMVVSFLQMTLSKSTDKYSHNNMMNLGHLLMGFFELYGSTFNYSLLGISVLDNGSYYQKRSRRWNIPDRPFLLSAENPNDPSLDIGKNSYDIRRIKRSFEYAYQVLCYGIRSQGGPNAQYNQTILGTIIRVDDTLQNREGPVTCGYAKIDFNGSIFDERKPQTKKRKKKSNRRNRN